ncbi:MAG: NYN domain-containing protein [Anaerolineaceae bacterium]
MILVIDGHNLIPKIPGLNLQDLDDEPKLIRLVQEYCRHKRASADLFFDGALPGFDSGIKGGLVHIHSIRKGKTADEAIIQFLDQKGKSAHNYTLVSSDHHVQVQARSLGAAVLSSDQFARDLIETLRRSEENPSGESKPLSSSEIDEWLEIFNPKNKNS